MDEALDSLVDLHDRAEVQHLGDRTLDHGAERVAGLHVLPRVGRELLDAQAEALLVDVDVEDHRLDLVALLEVIRRVLDLVGPGDVGHVDEAVDALLDADEETEVRDVADLAAHHGADRVALLEQLPRVGLDLLHAERDALGLDVDVEDHGLDDVGQRHDLRRMLDPLRPAHLGDVDEALDAVLELDEGAVVREADDLALDPVAHAVALGDSQPRVFGDLLETQADPLGLGVELEHHDLDLVAHLEHLARVVDAAPGHVGDVEQAVDAAQVDEATVVGDVLDDARHHEPDLEVLESLGLELGALLLEQGAAAQDDVAPLLVELDDLEVERLANVLLEVPHGAEVDLRAGEERLDADVDREAALHASGDRAVHQLVTLDGAVDLVPDLQLVSLLLGEDDLAVLVLGLLEVDVDLVAGRDGQLALGAHELLDGDLSLGLVADVDGDVVLGDLDHRTGDDLTFTRGVCRLVLLQHRCEVSEVVGQVGICGRGRDLGHRVRRVFCAG